MKSEIMLIIRKLEKSNKLITMKISKFQKFERQMEEFVNKEADQ